MVYSVLMVMLCDQKVKENLRARLESWKPIELAFSFREHEYTDGIWASYPGRWVIYAYFEESEKANVYSLPSIIEDLGGIVIETSIMQEDHLPEDL
jgi:hypothetical protein